MRFGSDANALEQIEDAGTRPLDNFDRPDERMATLSASDALRLIAGGQLSPDEFSAALAARALALDQKFQAWAFIDTTAVDVAVGASHRVRSAGATGPLHGIPVGVKDVIDVAGMPTAADYPPYQDNVASRDAVSVAELRAAGATILGKTTTCQLAGVDPTSTLNPWNVNWTPGGSSSGSAVAVATGMVPLALGTQTAASTLRPAAYNGVVGFKPTYGLISTRGILPLAPTLDHLGVFARSVEDVAVGLQVLRGELRRNDSVFAHPFWQSDAGRLEVRAFVPSKFIRERADDETRAHFYATLAHLEKVGLDVESSDPSDELARYDAAWPAILAFEAIREYGLEFHQGPDAFRPRLSELLRRGCATPEREYEQSLSLRSEFNANLAPLLSNRAAVIVTPATTEIVPPGRGTTGDPALLAWTSCGLPAISVPTGLSSGGAPQGLHIVGGRWTDWHVLAVARECERAIGFSDRPVLDDRGG